MVSEAITMSELFLDYGSIIMKSYDKKGNEKAPDFQLFIRDSINTQEEQKSVEIPPKIEPSTNIFAEFGNMVANDDDVIPF